VIFVPAAGLVAGMVHVLSGPDHLAAIAPLAADGRRATWKAGFVWGLGHTSGVLLVGGLALLVREVLPIEAISSVSERLVGVALIGVGLWGLRRALASRLHVHEHEHDGSSHAHVHVHAGRDAHAPHDDTPGHDHMHASLGFGVLHGLAGSSHVLGVLPALALPTRTAAVAYLLAYGVGSVAAMTAFSSAIGALAGRARTRGSRLYQRMLYTCSGAAILVGAAWLII
jgi:ABC-type nickel/cobalt efflux system permease component RcnA